MHHQPRTWMLARIAFIVLGVLLMSGSAGLAQGNQATMDPTEVVDAVGPGVVTVINEQQEPSLGGPGIVPAGSGTGFIIDDAGHIVTNEHVVRGGDQFSVIFADGSERPATLVSADPISAQPDTFLGMTVTVSAEVEEHLLTPHAFLLGDDAFLCVSVTPHPGLFVEATAYVTGEVGLFNLAEIERRTGVDLDDEALRGYEGQPFILVDALVVVA